MASTLALIRADGLKKYFRQAASMLALPAKRDPIRAVDGVSFEVRPHETLSLVGESGSGKTTTARMVLRLEVPSAGHIYFRDRDLRELSRNETRSFHRTVQAVFQDPWSSLNPRMRIGDIIAEPIRINLNLRRKETEERVRDLLVAVGLEPEHARDFPHEFSGGQRQRIAVARALSLNPSLIVLDEPVSSLDVSIGAQVMNLLKDLQGRFGASYLLVAHNLATVRYLSHRVMVMYLGQIVEQGTSEALFAKPLHPYTKALISASLPTAGGEGAFATTIGSDVPSATNPPPGCRFHTRCPFVFDRCSLEEPQLRELEPGHKVACHLY